MKIMLVDDEPIFLEILKKIIYGLQEETGIAIESIVECYSGEKAMRRLPEERPDIVFTDIKMQAMDGLELASSIHERWPGLPVVVVSGYSSFDYARDALRAGVADYLVKPIEPEAVARILERLKDKLYDGAYERSGRVLRSLLGQAQPEDGTVSESGDLAYPQYALLLIQNIEAALDKDSLMPYADAEERDRARRLLSGFEAEAEVWLFHTHNRKEIIAALGVRRADAGLVRQLSARAQREYAFGELAPAVAASGAIADPSLLGAELKRLQERLGRTIMIGGGAVSWGDANEPSPGDPAGQPTPAEEKQIAYAVQKADWELLRRTLGAMFERWRQERCPSGLLEMHLKRLLHRLNTADGGPDLVVSASIERALGEIVYTSRSYEEAAEAVVELLRSALSVQDRDQRQTGAERLFVRIEQYLLANLSSPLSLTQLMDVFGVSSTYLCSVFRSVGGRSFVEYLTQLRIDAAKRLMRERPDMPLKDVAELTGYADRHYFTKVFKAIAGQTPSDYKNACAKEQ